MRQVMNYNLGKGGHLSAQPMGALRADYAELQFCFGLQEYSDLIESLYRLL
jgi:hypothetical protein